MLPASGVAARGLCSCSFRAQVSCTGRRILSPQGNPGMRLENSPCCTFFYWDLKASWWSASFSVFTLCCFIFEFLRLRSMKLWTHWLFLICFPLHPLALLKAQSVDQQHWHYLGACHLPWWLSGKESTCNAGSIGETGSIPGSDPPRFPGGEHGNPLQYSCLENPHGQRSLVGYSPWGHKVSDMTEVT